MIKIQSEIWKIFKKTLSLTFEKVEDRLHLEKTQIIFGFLLDLHYLCSGNNNKTSTDMATKAKIVEMEWSELPLEERKRRVAIREATSKMMQGSITCEKYGVYATK